MRGKNPRKRTLRDYAARDDTHEVELYEALCGDKVEVGELVARLEDACQDCEAVQLFQNVGILLLKACGLGELAY
jgi:hypothetical protein